MFLIRTTTVYTSYNKFDKFDRLKFERMYATYFLVRDQIRYARTLRIAYVSEIL